ncbi:mucin-12-like [Eriocheir sinensis]|uniref:mucin-12-like n=1 Tax=Eriocheir sinensis TaxID=95602 RepID=UPI0021C8B2A2|nr:mucin-12-like [Eriocheir sinensis]
MANQARNKGNEVPLAAPDSSTDHRGRTETPGTPAPSRRRGRPLRRRGRPLKKVQAPPPTKDSDSLIPVQWPSSTIPRDSYRRVRFDELFPARSMTTPRRKLLEEDSRSLQVRVVLQGGTMGGLPGKQQCTPTPSGALQHRGSTACEQIRALPYPSTGHSFFLRPRGDKVTTPATTVRGRRQGSKAPSHKKDISSALCSRNHNTSTSFKSCHGKPTEGTCPLTSQTPKTAITSSCSQTPTRDTTAKPGGKAEFDTAIVSTNSKKNSQTAFSSKGLETPLANSLRNLCMQEVAEPIAGKDSTTFKERDMSDRSLICLPASCHSPSLPGITRNVPARPVKMKGVVDRSQPHSLHSKVRSLGHYFSQPVDSFEGNLSAGHTPQGLQQLEVPQHFQALSHPTPHESSVRLTKNFPPLSSPAPQVVPVQAIRENSPPHHLPNNHKIMIDEVQPLMLGPPTFSQPHHSTSLPPESLNKIVMRTPEQVPPTEGVPKDMRSFWPAMSPFITSGNMTQARSMNTAVRTELLENNMTQGESFKNNSKQAGFSKNMTKPELSHTNIIKSEPSKDLRSQQSSQKGMIQPMSSHNNITQTGLSQDNKTRSKPSQNSRQSGPAQNSKMNETSHNRIARTGPAQDGKTGNKPFQSSRTQTEPFVDQKPNGGSSQIIIAQTRTSQDSQTKSGLSQNNTTQKETSMNNMTQSEILQDSTRQAGSSKNTVTQGGSKSTMTQVGRLKNNIPPSGPSKNNAPQTETSMNSITHSTPSQNIPQTAPSNSRMTKGGLSRGSIMQAGPSHNNMAKVEPSKDSIIQHRPQSRETTAGPSQNTKAEPPKIPLKETEPSMYSVISEPSRNSTPQSQSFRSSVTQSGPAKNNKTQVGPSKNNKTQVGPSKNNKTQVGPSKMPITQIRTINSLAQTELSKKDLPPSQPSVSQVTNAGPSKRNITQSGPLRNTMTQPELSKGSTAQPGSTLNKVNQARSSTDSVKHSKLSTSNILQTRVSMSTAKQTRPVNDIARARPANNVTQAKVSTNNAKQTRPSMNNATQAESTNNVQQTEASTNNVQQTTVSTNNVTQDKPCTDNVSQPKPLNNIKQTRPSSDNTTHPRPSTNTVTQAKPSMNNVQQTKASTKNLTQARPSTDTIRQPRPSTDNIQKANPSTDTIRQPRPSTDDVQQAKPSMDTVQQTRPSTDNVQQARLSASILRQAKPFTNNVSRGKPSTDNVTKVRPSRSSIAQAGLSVNSMTQAEPSTSSVTQPAPPSCSMTQAGPPKSHTAHPGPSTSIAQPGPSTNRTPQVGPSSNSKIQDRRLSTGKTKAEPSEKCLPSPSSTLNPPAEPSKNRPEKPPKTHTTPMGASNNSTKQAGPFITPAGPVSSHNEQTGPSKNNVLSYGSSKAQTTVAGPSKSVLTMDCPSKNQGTSTGPYTNSRTPSKAFNNQGTPSGPYTNNMTPSNTFNTHVSPSEPYPNSMIPSKDFNTQTMPSAPYANNRTSSIPFNTQAVPARPSKNLMTPSQNYRLTKNLTTPTGTPNIIVKRVRPSEKQSTPARPSINCNTPNRPFKSHMPQNTPTQKQISKARSTESPKVLDRPSWHLMTPRRHSEHPERMPETGVPRRSSEPVTPSRHSVAIGTPGGPSKPFITPVRSPVNARTPIQTPGSVSSPFMPLLHAVSPVEHNVHSPLPLVPLLKPVTPMRCPAQPMAQCTAETKTTPIVIGRQILAKDLKAGFGDLGPFSNSTGAADSQTLHHLPSTDKINPNAMKKYQINPMQPVLPDPSPPSLATAASSSLPLMEKAMMPLSPPEIVSPRPPSNAVKMSLMPSQPSKDPLAPPYIAKLHVDALDFLPGFKDRLPRCTATRRSFDALKQDNQFDRSLSDAVLAKCRNVLPAKDETTIRTQNLTPSVQIKTRITTAGSQNLQVKAPLLPDKHEQEVSLEGDCKVIKDGQLHAEGGYEQQQHRVGRQISDHDSTGGSVGPGSLLAPHQSTPLGNKTSTPRSRESTTSQARKETEHNSQQSNKIGVSNNSTKIQGPTVSLHTVKVALKQIPMESLQLPVSDAERLHGSMPDSSKKPKKGRRKWNPEKEILKQVFLPVLPERCSARKAATCLCEQSELNLSDKENIPPPKSHDTDGREKAKGKTKVIVSVKTPQTKPRSVVEKRETTPVQSRAATPEPTGDMKTMPDPKERYRGVVLSPKVFVVRINNRKIRSAMRKAEEYKAEQMANEKNSGTKADDKVKMKRKKSDKEKPKPQTKQVSERGKRKAARPPPTPTPLHTPSESAVQVTPEAQQDKSCSLPEDDKKDSLLNDDEIFTSQKLKSPKPFSSSSNLPLGVKQRVVKTGVVDTLLKKLQLDQEVSDFTEPASSHTPLATCMKSEQLEIHEPRTPGHIMNFLPRLSQALTSITKARRHLKTPRQPKRRLPCNPPPFTPAKRQRKRQLKSREIKANDKGHCTPVDIEGMIVKKKYPQPCQLAPEGNTELEDFDLKEKTASPCCVKVRKVEDNDASRMNMMVSQEVPREGKGNFSLKQEAESKNEEDTQDFKPSGAANVAKRRSRPAKASTGKDLKPQQQTSTERKTGSNVQREARNSKEDTLDHEKPASEDKVAKRRKLNKEQEGSEQSELKQQPSQEGKSDLSVKTQIKGGDEGSQDQQTGAFKDKTRKPRPQARRGEGWTKPRTRNRQRKGQAERSQLDQPNPEENHSHTQTYIDLKQTHTNPTHIHTSPTHTHTNPTYANTSPTQSPRKPTPTHTNCTQMDTNPSSHMENKRTHTPSKRSHTHSNYTHTPKIPTQTFTSPSEHKHPHTYPSSQPTFTHSQPHMSHTLQKHTHSHTTLAHSHTAPTHTQTSLTYTHFKPMQTGIESTHTHSSPSHIHTAPTYTQTTLTYTHFRPIQTGIESSHTHSSHLPTHTITSKCSSTPSQIPLLTKMKVDKYKRLSYRLHRARFRRGYT